MSSDPDRCEDAVWSQLTALLSPTADTIYWTRLSINEVDDLSHVELVRSDVQGIATMSAAMRADDLGSTQFSDDLL